MKQPMCQKEKILKSQQEKSLEKSKEFILLHTVHTGFKGRYQITLLYPWECIELYFIMFILVIVTTQAYWNVMSIFRVQLWTHSYAMQGGKGL